MVTEDDPKHKCPDTGDGNLSTKVDPVKLCAVGPCETRVTKCDQADAFCVSLRCLASASHERSNHGCSSPTCFRASYSSGLVPLKTTWPKR